jgi:hypothetical protein
MVASRYQFSLLSALLCSVLLPLLCIRRPRHVRALLSLLCSALLVSAPGVQRTFGPGPGHCADTSDGYSWEL